MAHVELDYSIDQERAIWFQGRFFSSKVRVFRVSAFANHARPPPTRPDARLGQELLLLTSEEGLQALTLTQSYLSER